MIFLTVPAGVFQIGTTAQGVEMCVQAWKHQLIDNYSEDRFRSWIQKEFPAHKISYKEFEMSETLVTNEDVKTFLKDVPVEVPESILTSEPNDHPVWGVSYEWANRYADWLTNSNEEYKYRLPTETEWEIAARGTDFREYPYGHHFNSQFANTVESKTGKTTPVTAYKHAPGPYGHLDLAGNVEEWVLTKYYVYPNGELIQDNLYERFGQDYCILRGGSFACGGDLSRSARRHGPFPDSRFRYIGFRLVREKK